MPRGPRPVPRRLDQSGGLRQSFEDLDMAAVAQRPLHRLKGANDLEATLPGGCRLATLDDRLKEVSHLGLQYCSNEQCSAEPWPYLGFVATAFGVWLSLVSLYPLAHPVLYLRYSLLRGHT